MFLEFSLNERAAATHFISREDIKDTKHVCNKLGRSFTHICQIWLPSINGGWAKSTTVTMGRENLEWHTLRDDRISKWLWQKLHSNSILRHFRYDSGPLLRYQRRFTEIVKQKEIDRRPSKIRRRRQSKDDDGKYVKLWLNRILCENVFFFSWTKKRSKTSSSYRGNINTASCWPVFI